MTWTPGPAILTIGLLLPGILAGPAPAGEDVTPAPEKQPPVLDQELLRSAEKALGESRYEVALKQFERLAAEAPPDVRVFLGLGRTQTALGDGAGAVLSLVDALNLAERDYDVLLALAEALLLQGARPPGRRTAGTSEMALIDSRRMYEQATEVARTGRSRGSERAARRASRATPRRRSSSRSRPSRRTPRRHVARARQPAVRGVLERSGHARRRGRGGRPGAVPARLLQGPRDRLRQRLRHERSGLDPHAGRRDRPGHRVVREVRRGQPDAGRQLRQPRRAAVRVERERKRLVEILGNALRAAASFGSGAERQVTRAYVYYRRGMANSAARDAAAAARDLAEAARLTRTSRSRAMWSELVPCTATTSTRTPPSSS